MVLVLWDKLQHQNEFKQLKSWPVSDILCPSLCLQHCPSVRSMRSGGSCWSWLWWGSSSFWSWSSHCCCMDTAPSTRPVAQVCSFMLFLIVWYFSLLSVPSTHSLHSFNFLCLSKKLRNISHLVLSVEQNCLEPSCSYRTSATCKGCLKDENKVSLVPSPWWFKAIKALKHLKNISNYGFLIHFWYNLSQFLLI